MIPASLYQAIYINLLFILTVLYALSFQNMTFQSIYRGRDNYGSALLLSIILILFLGLRPVSYHFGDTVNYARTYANLQYGLIEYDPDASDWLFYWIMNKASKIMSVNAFFLIIEIGYIGCTLWACKRLMRNNVLIALLMNLVAFSFYSFGVNGIRNGLACSIMLTAFSYIAGSKNDKIIAAILSFCAYNTHHSMALPILMMVVSTFVLPKFKNSFKLTVAFWILSIFLSLAVGDSLETFFANLGFDDRLNTYITSDEFDDEFSNTGFRWDFLLYSVMPIILGWHVVVKKRVSDKTYLMLLNTYILCNSFWVMLIRASFSARFAYLSWFIYPMLLAYPLLKLPVWRKQGDKLTWIMLANIGFTYFMWLIGKYH